MHSGCHSRLVFRHGSDDFVESFDLSQESLDCCENARIRNNRHEAQTKTPVKIANNGTLYAQYTPQRSN